MKSKLIIQPRAGWQPVLLSELWQSRDVLRVMVWRDVTLRYRQTLFGGLWAVMQPLIAMLLFTVLFNRLNPLSSDGPAYPLFAFVGLLPWTFFANSVTMSSNSLLSNQALISKIYFPRLFIPLGSIGAFMLDMLVGLGLAFAMMVYYRYPATSGILLLPVFALYGAMAASGVGCLLAAVNVQYRDVKYVVPFLVQMGMFITPVIYPISYMPAKWRPLLALNPMTGVVLGFRYSILGMPLDWPIFVVSLSSATVICFIGLVVFRRMEVSFGDVI